MNLNSSSVILLLISLNSSVSLYLENSINQDWLENGYKMPDIGSHSVIDKPESEIRVYPPMIIIEITKTPRIRSQIENRLILFDIILKYNLNE